MSTIADAAAMGVGCTILAVLAIVITVGVSSCATTSSIKHACDIYGHVELYSANGSSTVMYTCAKDQHNESR